MQDITQTIETALKKALKKIADEKVVKPTEIDQRVYILIGIDAKRNLETGEQQGNAEIVYSAFVDQKPHRMMSLAEVIDPESLGLSEEDVKGFVEGSLKRSIKDAAKENKVPMEEIDRVFFMVGINAHRDKDGKQTKNATLAYWSFVINDNSEPTPIREYTLDEVIGVA